MTGKNPTSEQGSEALLQTQKLTVRYGHVDALHGVDLRLAAGQIVAVVGPNGAGKSSLLNAIMGDLPDGGSAGGRIRYAGQDVSNDAVERRFANGMALVPERRELFSSMSVEDNLVLGAYRRRPKGQHYRDGLERIYEIFPRLRERRRQLSGTLSGGERQMLALGRALMSGPRLLMLDEPSLGLAPRVTQEVFGIIEHLRSTGVGILLVEQNSRAALKISDYGYVLEVGSVLLEGPSEQVARDPRIFDAYIGARRAEPVAGLAAA